MKSFKDIIPRQRLNSSTAFSKGRKLTESAGAAHIQIMMMLEKAKRAQQFSSVGDCKIVRKAGNARAMWNVELVRYWLCFSGLRYARWSADKDRIPRIRNS